MKKLTPERFKEIGKMYITWEENYDLLLPYLADEGPEEPEVFAIPNHTVLIKNIEDIIISTAPAPLKISQITNLIEKYKTT